VPLQSRVNVWLLVEIAEDDELSMQSSPKRGYALQESHVSGFNESHSFSILELRA